MKIAFFQFLTTGLLPAIAAVVALFFLTIFLVAKRWIGISSAVILLLLSLAIGALINNPSMIEYSHATFTEEMEKQESFNKRILQAIEDVKQEVETERENLTRLKTQVQEILSEIENQKEKVEQFIDETKKQFQTEQTPS